MVEAQLVTAVASESEPPVHDARACAFDLQRLRCEREYAALQREIDRLQRGREGEYEAEIDRLLARKSALLQRIAELKFSDREGEPHGGGS